MRIKASDHIILRTYVPEDAPELFQRVNTNRAHLRTFLPWVDVTLKEEDSASFISMTIKQADKQEALAMGIYLDDVLIGGIGMHEWNSQIQKCQVGYWLVEDQQGKGYMLQSAAAFIDFLFAKTDVNKVEIQFLPYNQRSGALAQKLGAQVEGVIRHNVKVNGSFEDTVLTGILKKEWNIKNIAVQ